MKSPVFDNLKQKYINSHEKTSLDTEDDEDGAFSLLQHTCEDSKAKCKILI